MDIKEQMQELIQKLNAASYAYYQTDQEIMSNLEYDQLYDQLAQLEKESGIILSHSPTQQVGYEVVSELPKVEHARPMQSLDKTKDVQALASWLGDRRGMLSWKLDGLTVILTYENGALTLAATRGNGNTGEVITPNAKVFQNVPLRIPYTGRLVVRGKRSFLILILSGLTKQWKKGSNIKIRATFAAVPCGSWIAVLQQSVKSVLLRTRWWNVARI